MNFGSFFQFIKAFLMNRVLPKAPGWLIRLYFYEVVEPKAQDDLKAIEDKLREYRMKEMHEAPSFSAKPHRPTPLVIGLVGLPQEGKSTLAEILAGRLHAFRVNGNLIRGLLIDQGLDYANVNALIFSIMLMQLRFGESVILDVDCMSPLKRAFIMALAEPFGARIRYVQIATDHRVWQERMYQFGDQINRMYADGIRRAKGLGPKAPVSLPEIWDCVRAEWSRQEEEHIKYATTWGKKPPVFVPNSGTFGDIKAKVEEIFPKLK